MKIAPQFLTEKETAEITRMSMSTLRNDRSRGVGINYYKINRAVRYKLEDVMEWMDSRKIIVNR